MNGIFRVDASVALGTGHVMRCLALAEELRGAGWNVSFICRELTGNLCYLIEAQGFAIRRLPKPDLAILRPSARAYSQWLSHIDACRKGRLYEVNGGSIFLLTFGGETLSLATPLATLNKLQKVTSLKRFSASASH